MTKMNNKVLLLLAMTGFILVTSIYIYFNNTAAEVVADKQITIDKINLINNSHNYDMENLNNVEIIFYFKLAGFSCTPCYQDFLQYADYISNEAHLWRDRALFLNDRNELSIEEQKKRLEIWREANYISKDIEINIANNFGETFNIEKNAILILTDEKNFETFYLPLTSSEFTYLEKKITIR